MERAFLEKHLPLVPVWYMTLHLIRALVIWACMPVLSRMGYGISRPEGMMMVYGGLRGAVSLCMALMVDLDPKISQDIKDVIFFHVAGVVSTTLCINGMTCAAVYNRLNPDPENKFNVHFLTTGLRRLTLQTAEFVQAAMTDGDFHFFCHKYTLMQILPNFGMIVIKANELTEDEQLQVNEILFGKEAILHSDTVEKTLQNWKKAKIFVRSLGVVGAGVREMDQDGNRVDGHRRGLGHTLNGTRADEVSSAVAQALESEHSAHLELHHQLRRMRVTMVSSGHDLQAMRSSGSVAARDLTSLREEAAAADRPGSAGPSPQPRPDRASSSPSPLTLSAKPGILGADLLSADLQDARFSEHAPREHAAQLRTQKLRKANGRARNRSFHKLNQAGLDEKLDVLRSFRPMIDAHSRKDATRMMYELCFHAMEASYTATCHAHSRPQTDTWHLFELLRYELCFHAMEACYNRLHHEEQISMGALAYLLDAVKHGQDVLVRNREGGTMKNMKACVATLILLIS